MGTSSWLVGRYALGMDARVPRSDRALESQITIPMMACGCRSGGQRRARDQHRPAQTHNNNVGAEGDDDVRDLARAVRLDELLPNVVQCGEQGGGDEDHEEPDREPVRDRRQRAHGTVGVARQERRRLAA